MLRHFARVSVSSAVEDFIFEENVRSVRQIFTALIDHHQGVLLLLLAGKGRFEFGLDGKENLLDLLMCFTTASQQDRPFCQAAHNP